MIALALVARRCVTMADMGEEPARAKWRTLDARGIRVSRQEFSRVRLGPSLLRIEANGSRYFIARDQLGGGLWLASDVNGVVSASPLAELSGTSTEPFDNWIAAGVTPPRTRVVEVESSTGKQRARFRIGMWIAAVPVTGQYLNFSVCLLDGDGRVVGTCEDEAFVPRRSLQNPPR